MSYERCSSDNCERAAQFAPKICVPATGYLAVEASSLQAIMGLKLCKECCQKFDAKEQFFDLPTRDVWRKIFVMLARASGSSIPPDFARAFVKQIPLDGNEFLTFERLQSTRH